MPIVPKAARKVFDGDKFTKMVPATGSSWLTRRAAYTEWDADALLKAVTDFLNELGPDRVITVQHEWADRHCYTVWFWEYWQV